MNGLTQTELAKLAEIRRLARLNLSAAKRQAIQWINANKSRRVLRSNASRTVKNLYAFPPKKAKKEHNCSSDNQGYCWTCGEVANWDWYNLQ